VALVVSTVKKKNNVAVHIHLFQPFCN